MVIFRGSKKSWQSHYSIPNLDTYQAVNFYMWQVRLSASFLHPQMKGAAHYCHLHLPPGHLACLRGSRSNTSLESTQGTSSALRAVNHFCSWRPSGRAGDRRHQALYARSHQLPSFTFTSNTPSVAFPFCWGHTLSASPLQGESRDFEVFTCLRRSCLCLTLNPLMWRVQLQQRCLALWLKASSPSFEAPLPIAQWGVQVLTIFFYMQQHRGSSPFLWEARHKQAAVLLGYSLFGDCKSH